MRRFKIGPIVTEEFLGQYFQMNVYLSALGTFFPYNLKNYFFFRFIKLQG